ncbi:CHRD domain-containing protein [Ornithinimicrobium sp. Arc0846-15]|nr:CHRD domain-containing protein [Ornithinimicrobium laminariae]
MRKTRFAPLAIAAIVGLPLAFAGPAAADHEQDLMAELTQLNDSGASGTAYAGVSGTEVTISLETSGLLAEAPHAQHIHIGGTNTCPDPNMEGTGFEGAIRTTDAAGSYGGVQVSLTKEPGETGPDAALDVANFPTGDATYSRTIEVSQEVADQIAAGDGVVVVHGVDHDGDGEYGGDIESDLDPSLPSEATDPAACGELNPTMDMPAGGVDTGGGSTAGMEYAGVAAFGALALGAGVVGIAATRRRENASS